MSADVTLGRLREMIDERGISLAELSRRTAIPYNRIYRFHTQAAELSLNDADTLHLFLTGKSLINTTELSDRDL